MNKKILRTPDVSRAVKILTDYKRDKRPLEERLRAEG